MAKTISTVLGVVLILVGLVGFVSPDFLGTHLNLSHNLVHLITGAIALYFGLKGSLPAARTFCLVFGAIYLLLGVVGFIAGTTEPGASMANSNLWEIGPLMLGRMDHIVHVLLGILFLIGGLMTKSTTSAAD